ncbi:MAG: S8 family serine peptidase [Thermodesulfobacteriota bacterium]
MTYNKIDAGLLVALKHYQTEGRAGLTRHIRSLGIIFSEHSPKPARVVVFIHCDEQAQLDHLSQYGVRVNQSSGNIRTAFLPLDSLESVSDDPVVKRIIASRYLLPLMDVASPRVHIPTFRNNTGLNGSGVIIGVVDTGIYSNHPAFTGRILRIWDQIIPGPGVNEGGYGFELVGNQLTVSRDQNGHGTHVAGIAAGAGLPFEGIAPKAELVVVKTDFDSAHIADAIWYIFRIAKDLGRSAVVNLSLGGHYDAHDGSDSLSQVIDKASGPGRIVCCAAGNEGDKNIHAQIAVRQGQEGFIRFQVPADSFYSTWINGWYSGDDQIEVAVQSPSGFQTPYQGIISDSDNNPANAYMLADGEVSIVTPGPKDNRDHNFLIDISRKFAPITGGTWQVRWRGVSINRGLVDVWAGSVDGLGVIFTSNVEHNLKIGSPGASASAVTAASYTTKVKWTDIDDNPQEVGSSLDNISDFSSDGPLRNGVHKPDIAAPGEMIISCLSADSTPDRGEMINQQYRIWRGTSMATPFMSGIVALLLQRDPTLDPEGVKALLRANSLIPGQPPGTFDSKWGFGLIDALGI